MKNEKLIIKGSATLDQPQGIVTTRSGALRFARSNMPTDLKFAGFVAMVQRGFYGDYWVIGYAK